MADERATLLIVDDERGPAESLRMIFKTSYDVVVASGGMEALEVIRQRSVDVVTLDLRMPVMPGVEVLERIKQFDPDIEVIIVTGYSSLDTALDGIRFGAFDYIAKPFDVPQVTELVRRAVARRRSRLRSRSAKEDFLSNLSHELRTPLSAIIGYSSILGDELHPILTEDQRFALGRIRTNSVDLLQLIEDVMLLNAIEAGDVEPFADTFDIVATVRRAIDRARPIALAKHLDVSLVGAPDAYHLFSDEGMVERILDALLDNAMKFTGSGQLDVRIAVGNKMLSIGIQDTGVGMSDEDLRRALQGLTQADASHSRSHRGLGLGLRLATRLTNLLGGELDVRSKTQAGTYVELRLPNGAPSASSLH